MTPPDAFPDANLRVDIRLDQGQMAKWKENSGDPMVWRARLSCPTNDRITLSLLGWMLYAPVLLWFQETPWCNTSALNVPVAVDTDGLATLWFSVDPPPYRAWSIRWESGVPNMFFGLSQKGGGTGIEPEIISFDHWEVQYLENH